MNIKKILSLLLLLIVFASCGGGGGSNKHLSHLTDDEKAAFVKSMLEVFDFIDLNSDGYITYDEATLVFQERFIQKDKDGDGKIEQEDYSNDSNVVYVIPYDKDGDGVASHEEYDSFYREVFQNRLDINGSGRISKDEFISAFEIY